jgi:transposase
MEKKFSKPRIIPINNKKNGITYLYHDQFYWDTEKQQTRHKRVCIGKIDAKTGKQVFNQKYIANKTKKTPLQGKTPFTLHSVGQILLLQHLVKTLKLEKTLRISFGEAKTSKLLALAYYCTCKSEPLSQGGKWLTQHGLDTSLTGHEQISEFLSTISEDSQQRFFDSWKKNLPATELSVYDLTSSASYGKHNYSLYYGNNREIEALEQVNLALVCNKKTGLPLAYFPLPGNLRNGKAAESVFSQLCVHTPEKSCFFVLNRIFYSPANLEYLRERGFKYMIGIPSRIAWKNALIEDFRRHLDEQEPFFDYRNKTLKYQAYPSFDGKSTIAVYFDPVWRKQQENNLENLLACCYSELATNCQVEEHSQLYDRYFEVRKNPGGTRRVIKKVDPKQLFFLSNAGFWTMQTNSIEDPAKILEQYKKRNELEVYFENLKNETDCQLLQINEPQKFSARLFIQFLSVVITSALDSALHADARLDAFNSAQQMLDAMESFSTVLLSDSSLQLFTSPTEMQSLLSESLHFVLPKATF